MSKDATLQYMFKNLPPKDWTLATYVSINWCGEKTVDEVVNDGELAADLPEELYPEPVTEVIQ